MTTPNEKLRKLAESSTAGPWINGNDEDSDYCLVGPHDGDGIVYRPVVKLHNEVNAEYIAAANPTAIIALLDQLQSQAERIAELEADIERKSDAVQRLWKERDTLRAQLDAIAATEPVLVVEKEPDYWSGGHFHEGSKSHIGSTKVWRLPIGTKLFTHPVPAQDVTELVDCLDELCDIVEGVVEDKSSVGSLIDSFTTQPARAALSKYKGAK